MKLRREAMLLLLIALSGVLGGGGCAAAGLAAAGPLFTALQFVGERSVERSLPADLTTAWIATVDTLTRMEIRVRETGRSGESWGLEGVGETVRVHATLTRVTPRMTRLSLRVEAGGLLADKQTAAEILNQVAIFLAGPTAVAKRGPSVEQAAHAEALAALEREIRRLRSEIEEKRVAHRPPPEPGAAGPVVARKPGILVIPLSYGVPAFPGPANMPVLRTTPALSYDGGAPIPADAPFHNDAGRTAALAAPLSPVSVLTPVPALADRQSGQ